MGRPDTTGGPIVPFHPYLFFGGNCRQAFTRYHDIFGGELQVMAYADAPPGEAPPGVAADLVMHTSLTVGDDLLMGSDDPTPGFGPVQGMAVHWSAPDAAEAKRVFEALADGGEVQMPMAETFWSPAFGACTDRFGTPWMVSAEPAS
jgi:PhnB protein